MSSPTTVDDEQLAALVRSVERNGRRVTALDALVRQLAGDLAEVAATLVPEAAGPDPVRSWLLSQDPEQAVTDLADLVGWTRRVFLRYPDAVLSACWLWHPEVIEELWWLRRAHAEAFDPKAGTWLRVGDWHDRQRPGVAKRVRAAIGTCELSLHRTGTAHARPAAPAPLADHAEPIAVAWTKDALAPRPEPTDEQLHEADAYMRQQHRRT
ncbi:hypothetical protein [Pseudonocardia broussonetiae]|uniref:DUF4913 domain-containing protein n=1 Tax=Pseudonocardia broussonetiae TaxID=2736640 RepID=A0A6M6JF71_9PSEU|nr:hypothetical protein [Pseudonocardia broussonetiae]QJY45131.1 hypothetical protein HOP40_04240 [Pseudonocardia broussonetiae]